MYEKLRRIVNVFHMIPNKADGNKSQKLQSKMTTSLYLDYFPNALHPSEFCSLYTK